MGDVHGCLTSLEAMFSVLRPGSDDLVVMLGDYVDRGPDSCGVIDYLLNQKGNCDLVTLMGNHEIQMLRALDGEPHLSRFLSGLCGGRETLDSYGGSFDDVPDEHWDFMRGLKLYHELEDHLLVHAGVEAGLGLEDQNRETFYYQRFYEQQAHESGKVVVCGHTVQGDLPTNRGYAVCLDTCAYGGGWLSALEVDTGKIWQTNEQGEVREMDLGDLVVES